MNGEQRQILARLLRSHRAANDLSLEQFAAELGMPAEKLEALEEGTYLRPIAIVEMLRIGERIDLAPVSEFWGGFSRNFTEAEFADTFERCAEAIRNNDTAALTAILMEGTADRAREVAEALRAG